MDLSIKFYDVLFNHLKVIKPTAFSSGSFEFPAPLKRVCLLMEEPHSTEKKNIITKIMTACLLQPEDYSLCGSLPWKQLRTETMPEVVILFGITEKELELTVELPVHRPVTFDHRIWIKSWDINRMMQRNDLKNELWKNALKPVFLNEH